ETQRRFGGSVLETSYTEAGRLHSLTLSTPNADPRTLEYRYTPRGQLSDIVSPFASQHYEYDGTGRLIHERSAHRSADYHLDLAGNRLINRYMPEAFMADMRHPGNRLSEDAHFHYQYDAQGNLSQKISKRDAGEVHHYRYDRSHRLVSYLCYQDGEALRGGRYCYDPLGRRIGKQVMQRNQPKHISWFGWDGDKLVLTERDGTRIHTVYLPRSFVPLLRFEGDKPPIITPLADKLEQEVGIALPPDFKQTLHHIEQALRANRLSTEQHAWLNQVQLSPDYLENLLDPLPDTPYAAQLYDCNHLGTPLQLINLNGHIDWSITLDAWGNALSEENPHQLHQPIRMQGQQYDEESGLHFNRHRYYDPTIGRYITQDPIELEGGTNFYRYTVNPLQQVDPLGLYNLYDLFIEQWKDNVEGTSSTDISGAIDIVSIGGSAGAGIAFGKKKGELISDICGYLTACGHAGIGGGLSAAITETTTSSQPSTGLSNSAGIFGSGAFLGKFGVAIQTDMDNPELASTSGSVGIGAGAFAGTLVCYTAQFCLEN
ncbi:MAG: RHS repeat-associated core domain-containing protein, partial [Hafnia sp.]